MSEKILTAQEIHQKQHDELFQDLLRALEEVGNNTEPADSAKTQALEAKAVKHRNLLADFLRDAGKHAEADCQDWLVAHGKRPYCASLPSASVFRDAAMKEQNNQLGDVASDYPDDLFAKLTGGKAVANHRTYPTLAECEQDVAKAWLACVAAGVDPTGNDAAKDEAKKSKK